MARKKLTKKKVNLSKTIEPKKKMYSFRGLKVKHIETLRKLSQENRLTMGEVLNAILDEVL